MRRTVSMAAMLMLGPLVMAPLVPVAGCGDPSEAERFDVPVQLVPPTEAVTTDLGYTVTLTGLRAAVANFRFTVEGEIDARAPVLFGASTALAHPGHFQGGEVTGEMLGDYVIDWFADDRTLGIAQLIGTEYNAADIDLRTFEGEGPLNGHTAIVEGQAVRGDDTVSFTVAVDAPEGRAIIGIPFEATVGAETSALLFSFLMDDPFEDDTLFDGVDFAALAGEGTLVLNAASADDAATAYAAVRRAFLSHDHTFFQAAEAIR
ncbi:MAG: hypothetical protein AAF645_15565 [Myxococcota bacterium]